MSLLFQNDRKSLLEIIFERILPLLLQKKDFETIRHDQYPVGGACHGTADLKPPAKGSGYHTRTTADEEPYHIPHEYQR